MGVISLKCDFSFKHLMLNEEVRRYFVSDVLGIPVEEIRSVKLCNSFLWKRYFKQKQGILDVLLELNDDRKINIELQIRRLKHWDRRNLFYLAKMFTEDLLVGEDYEKLKRCICISILDYNMDDGPEYHKIYRLKNQQGNEFSDLLELHIIELRKTLKGTERVDDWIRLLNAETEEELAMVKGMTVNPGILTAVNEVKRMSLVKNLRVLYEAHLKERRDKMARDAYVRDEGIVIGRAGAVLRLLAEYGKVPGELEQAIQAEKDMGKLDEWLKLAAKAESIEDFREKAGL